MVAFLCLSDNNKREQLTTYWEHNSKNIYLERKWINNGRRAAMLIQLHNFICVSMYYSLCSFGINKVITCKMYIFQKIQIETHVPYNVWNKAANIDYWLTCLPILCNYNIFVCSNFNVNIMFTFSVNIIIVFNLFLTERKMDFIWECSKRCVDSFFFLFFLLTIA